MFLRFPSRYFMYNNDNNTDDEQNHHAGEPDQEQGPDEMLRVNKANGGSGFQPNRSSYGDPRGTEHRNGCAA